MRTYSYDASDVLSVDDDKQYCDRSKWETQKKGDGI